HGSSRKNQGRSSSGPRGDHHHEPEASVPSRALARRRLPADSSFARPVLTALEVESPRESRWAEKSPLDTAPNSRERPSANGASLPRSLRAGDGDRPRGDGARV